MTTILNAILAALVLLGWFMAVQSVDTISSGRNNPAVFDNN